MLACTKAAAVDGNGGDSFKDIWEVELSHVTSE